MNFGESLVFASCFCQCDTYCRLLLALAFSFVSFFLALLLLLLRLYGEGLPLLCYFLFQNRLRLGGDPLFDFLACAVPLLLRNRLVPLIGLHRYRSSSIDRASTASEQWVVCALARGSMKIVVGSICIVPVFVIVADRCTLLMTLLCIGLSANLYRCVCTSIQLDAPRSRYALYRWICDRYSAISPTLSPILFGLTLDVRIGAVIRERKGTERCVSENNGYWSMIIDESYRHWSTLVGTQIETER